MRKPADVEVQPGLWKEEFVEGTYLLTEKGRLTAIIHLGGSAKKLEPPTPVPAYQVRASGNVGQEILNSDGKIVAWTTDESMAKRICYLLIACQNVQDRKTPSGS